MNPGPDEPLRYSEQVPRTRQPVAAPESSNGSLNGTAHSGKAASTRRVPASRTSRRRLGRPVASDGDERRRLIVEAARREFSRSGYIGTTNREIAEKAGITTGAIYHYFRSKQDVYLAVFHETDRVILARYEEVTADASLSFSEMVASVLEVSSQLNSEDESLAAFLASASVDAHRNPELLPSYQEHDRKISGFFNNLLDRGAEEGVVTPENRSDILDSIRVATLGLTWFSVRVQNPEIHRRATAATIRALRGELFVAPRSRRRRAAG